MDRIFHNKTLAGAFFKTHQRSVQKGNKKICISRGLGSCCDY